MKTDSEIMALLQEPFEESDLEWRVQNSGCSNGGKFWAMVIPYITNRAIQSRLDDVFGPFEWENVYQATPDGKGYLCGIKVEFNGKTVTKWDGSEYTQVEALKGALSGAMKRAAVQFGIGRYLYDLEAVFAQCEPCEYPSQTKQGWNFANVKLGRDKNSPRKGMQWLPPALPVWAVPSIKGEQLIETLRSSKTKDELKENWANVYKYAKSFKRDEVLKKGEHIKNELKAKFDNQAEQQTQTASQMAYDFVARQIAEQVETSTNMSVLTGVKQKMQISIAKYCQDAKLSPSPYIQMLNDAVKLKESTL